MEINVNQRIRKIIDFLNMSDRAFSASIDIPQSTISNLFKRGTSPNINVLSSIIKTYQFINPVWLLTGNGEMTNDSVKKNNSDNTLGDNSAFVGGDMTIQGNYSVGDSHINLVLPEAGYQKIISSSGKETTIRLSDDELPAVESLSAENRFLKQTIDELKARIAVKDELLIAKEEIISMYKSKAKGS